LNPSQYIQIVKEVPMYRNICKKFQVLVPVALILVGLGLAHGQPASAANPPVATQSDSAVIPTASDLSTAIAKVAQAAIPAVVHIEVTQRSEVNNPMQPFENDPFFQYDRYPSPARNQTG